MTTFHQDYKKRMRAEKLEFQHKSAALIEFLEFAYAGGFRRRFKISWNILFKKIKLIKGVNGETKEMVKK